MFSSDSLFSRFMSMACDVLIIGILWMVCCIPLVTAGASTTAAYYTMSKSVRHKTGYIRKEFFKSFRLNLKQSLPTNLLFLIMAAVAAFDIQYLWTNENKTNNILFVIMIGIVFLILCMTIYYCPFLSRFEKKNMELVKMCALVAFKFLPITIGVLVVTVLAVVGVYLMPWAIFFIPGIYLYALTYPMEFIMKRLMPKPEEDSEEAQKWYYQ